jgi:hypothetical protein
VVPVAPIITGITFVLLLSEFLTSQL